MAECPFSWTEQEQGCWIFKTSVWKPVECRASKCMLWTGSDCVLNTISDRLKNIQDSIERLETIK